MAFEIAKAGWLHRQSSILQRWKKNWFVLYLDGHLKYFERQDSHVADEAILLSVACVSIRVGLQASCIDPPSGCTRQSFLEVKLRDGKTWHLCAESPDDMSAWHIALEQARVISRPQAAPPTYAVVPPACPVVPPAYGQASVIHTPGAGRVPYATSQYVLRAQPGQTVMVGQPGQTIVQGQPGQTIMVAQPGQTIVQGQPGQTIVQGQPGQTTVVYTQNPHYRHRAGGTDLAVGVMAGAALGTMMWGPLLWW